MKWNSFHGSPFLLSGSLSVPSAGVHMAIDENCEQGLNRVVKPSTSGLYGYPAIVLTGYQVSVEAPYMLKIIRMIFLRSKWLDGWPAGGLVGAPSVSRFEMLMHGRTARHSIPFCVTY